MNFHHLCPSEFCLFHSRPHMRRIAQKLIQMAVIHYGLPLVSLTSLSYLPYDCSNNYMMKISNAMAKSSHNSCEPWTNLGRCPRLYFPSETHRVRRLPRLTVWTSHYPNLSECHWQSAHCLTPPLWNTGHKWIHVTNNIFKSKYLIDWKLFWKWSA